MKRLFLILLASLMLTPLSACGSFPADPANYPGGPDAYWTDTLPDEPGNPTGLPYFTYIPHATGYGGPSETEGPSAVRTPDNSALTEKWKNYMRMPTNDEILSVKGIARSPYISMYYNFPDLGKALEYCVDMRADHQPDGTYLCPFNWWLNVSSLQKRYASVYNDYTGTPGGYCGFQTLGDGSRVFIMSEWSTFCKDHSGNVTVFTPEVIYPEGKGKGNTDSSEGTFTQCIVPYDWSAGRDYRVLLQQSLSHATGNVVYTVYVCDLMKGRWDKLVSIDTGVPDVYISSIAGFSENFLPEHTGEVRSMELFNLRARSAETYRWVSADSVRFILNGSLGISNYIGSAAYGTEGCSIRTIASGVSGLCPDPPADVTYPLAPGDSTDPY